MAPRHPSKKQPKVKVFWNDDSGKQAKKKSKKVSKAIAKQEAGNLIRPKSKKAQEEEEAGSDGEQSSADSESDAEVKPAKQTAADKGKRKGKVAAGSNSKKSVNRQIETGQHSGTDDASNKVATDTESTDSDANTQPDEGKTRKKPKSILRSVRSVMVLPNGQAASVKPGLTIPKDGSAAAEFLKKAGLLLNTDGDDSPKLAFETAWSNAELMDWLRSMFPHVHTYVRRLQVKEAKMSGVSQKHLPDVFVPCLVRYTKATLDEAVEKGKQEWTGSYVDKMLPSGHKETGRIAVVTPYKLPKDLLESWARTIKKAGKRRLSVSDSSHHEDDNSSDGASTASEKVVGGSKDVTVTRSRKLSRRDKDTDVSDARDRESGSDSGPPSPTVFKFASTSKAQSILPGRRRSNPVVILSDTEELPVNTNDAAPYEPRISSPQYELPNPFNRGIPYI